MSRAQQIAWSAAAWWALTVLPALLVAGGLFGDVDADTDVEGPVILTWVVGYLLQMGTIYLVGAAAGFRRMWWIFVASALPWVVDFTAPYGTPQLLAGVLGAAVLAGAIAYTALRHLALTEGGRAVAATVLKVYRNRMNVVINNVYIRRTVLLEIPAADGTTYQGKLHLLYEIGTGPSVGETLRLRVDARNPRRYCLDPTELSRR